MVLARVVRVERFIGICPEHPHWAVPASPFIEEVEELVHEHNEAEHEGIETND